MNSYNITAVLAANRNLNLLQKFYGIFRKNFPEVPLVVSCLAETEPVSEWLLQQNDSCLQVLVGKPKDGHVVSFSELYNAGINAVQTDKLVLIHNDQVFNEGFFEILDSELSPKEFMLYTTIEPVEYSKGFVRPAKYLASFGTDFDNFDYDGFYRYCSNLNLNSSEYGYGFYLAGYKSLFEKVGGFDQNTFVPVFCEDEDFTARLRTKGYFVRINSEAICYHFYSQTSRGYATEISQGELNNNLNFYNKWGFEVRRVWNTGYESIPKFRVNSWKVAVQNLDESVLKYVPRCWNIVDKQPELVLEQVGKINNSAFVQLVGSLSLVQKALKEGTFEIIPGLKLTVNKLKSSKCVTDNTNYLSLQGEIVYE